jgi:hypothetical protein
MEDLDVEDPSFSFALNIADVESLDVRFDELLFRFLFNSI